MKSDYLLIASVASLAIGLSLLCGYTHGTAGFNVAYPASGATLQVAIKTTGLPVMIGVPLTLLGIVLLIIAVISAIARQIPGPSGA